MPVFGDLVKQYLLSFKYAQYANSMQTTSGVSFRSGMCLFFSEYWKHWSTTEYHSDIWHRWHLR